MGHDVMQQLYDRYDAKQFATLTPDIGSFDHPRFVQICRLVGESEKILDVGSGFGEFSRKLAKRGKKVVAWDISNRTIEMCKSAGIEAYQINIETDPFIDCGTFDVILMLEIFEHLIDPLVALAKLKDLLNPRGLLVLSTPNAAYIKWRLQLLFGGLPDFGEDRILSDRPYNLLHKTPVTYDALRQVLATAGFEITSVEAEDYGVSVGWSKPGLRHIREWLRKNWLSLFAGSFVVSARPFQSTEHRLV